MVIIYVVLIDGGVERLWIKPSLHFSHLTLMLKLKLLLLFFTPVIGIGPNQRDFSSAIGCEAHVLWHAHQGWTNV